TAHDVRILNEALDDLIYEFPILPSDKYYVCDAAYMHTRGFMAPYRNVRYWLGDFRRKRAMTSKEKFNHAHAKLRNVIEHAFGVLKASFPILKSLPKFPLVKQRDITIACFAIHNFIRKKGLSDDFFAQYDQSDIHVNENVHDDNDGDAEVAQPIGSEADQQYMINLRDEIATQIMQARYDKRNVRGPLSKFISQRNIYEARLCENAYVESMVSADNWKWTSKWYQKFPILKYIKVPVLEDGKKTR
ncbi:putative nuclease HARBI1, partial [Tanacetum coccineum]